MLVPNEDFCHAQLKLNDKKVEYMVMLEVTWHTAQNTYHTFSLSATDYDCGYKWEMAKQYRMF